MGNPLKENSLNVTRGGRFIMKCFDKALSSDEELVQLVRRAVFDVLLMKSLLLTLKYECKGSP